MCQPECPEIPDHETIPESELRLDLPVARHAWPEQIEIRAVNHDVDLVRGNPTAHKIGLERRGQRQDSRRSAVQEQFELLKHAQRERPAGERFRGRDASRPQIANLEHVRHAPQARVQYACQRHEKMRRGRDDDVRTVLTPGHQEGGECIRDVIERASEGSLVRADVGEHPHDADAIEHFYRSQGVAIAREQLAFGKVGGAAQYRDLVSLRHPKPGTLVHMGGRRRGLGEEMIGKKQDPHYPERPVSGLAPSLTLSRRTTRGSFPGGIVMQGTELSVACPKRLSVTVARPLTWSAASPAPRRPQSSTRLPDTIALGTPMWIPVAWVARTMLPETISPPGGSVVTPMPMPPHPST